MGTGGGKALWRAGRPSLRRPCRSGPGAAVCVASEGGGARALVSGLEMGSNLQCPGVTRGSL